MRHQKRLGKLKRVSGHRSALLRNMATSLVSHGRILTTLAKAKEVRSYVEKIITKGKDQTLHSRRQVAAKLYTPVAVKTLCDDLSVRFNDRPGGYTRIVRIGKRWGDTAEMCHLEFVDYVMPTKAKASKDSKESAPAGK